MRVALILIVLELLMVFWMLMLILEEMKVICSKVGDMEDWVRYAHNDVAEIRRHVIPREELDDA